jgi:cell division protein FtsZ
MAQQGKRASMREGPLTALFRKTEEETQAEEGAQQTLPDADAGAESTAPSAPEPERQPRAQEDSAPASKESVDVKPAVARSESKSAVVRSESKPAVARPESKLPAPKARMQEPEEEPAHIPTPRERLRNVFSAEIPANMMERPGAEETPSAESAAETGAQTAAARAAQEERVPSPEGPPAMDVYAREEPRAFGQAGPVIHPVIRVVGVGGAGVNAVNRMVEAEVEGVEFLAINTDLQSLQQSTADITLHIGAELTRGLGSGSDTNLGRAAAMEDYDRAKALLKGSDMVFITAGAGGGTGTGAAPIVARIAREVGALTVAIVTKPFGFEGSRRAEQAATGVDALAEEVDTLIVVPNNRLLSVLDKQTSMVEAFRVADDVLRQGVQGISDLVTLPGLINLDFADVRTIMSGAGSALLGIGMGAGGEHRATEAAMQAVASPLLETSMEGARSILLSITGGSDLSLWEVNEAAKAVSEAAHPDANIIFGAMVDEKLEEQVWVTVVATGYEPKRGERPSRGRLEEPAGEPRVQRAAPGSSGRRERDRRGGLGMGELEVPEFMPRV